MPKLKQLEQLQLELDNDEENQKIKNGLLNKPHYNLKAIDQAGKFRHLRALLGPGAAALLSSSHAMAAIPMAEATRNEKHEMVQRQRRRKGGAHGTSAEHRNHDRPKKARHCKGLCQRRDSSDRLNTMKVGGGSSSAECGTAMNVPHHANKQDSSASINTLVCESTGINGAKSSPSGVLPGA